MVRAALLHEPINEMAVVYLFGTGAAKLGFMVTLIQAGFPDCIAHDVGFGGARREPLHPRPGANLTADQHG
jgi:hypothetical protein